MNCILKLVNIKIKNYKSIKKIDMKLNDYNPFVGKNNVGKSNILSAINLLMDPKLSSEFKDNFYNSNKPLEISGTFKCDKTIDKKFIKEHKNYMKQNSIDIEIILKSNDKKKLERYYNNDKEVLKFSAKSSPDIVKSLPSVVYVKAEEILEETSKVKKNNSFGILIQNLITGDTFFKNYDKTINDALKKKHDNAFDKISDTINKEFKQFSEMRLKIKLPSPTLEDNLKNIKILTNDDKSMFDSGTAFHRLTILAILMASNKVNSKKSKQLILLIDEPEIFLHPTLLYHMYQTLREYSQSSQVIFSTHNPNFIQECDLKNIHLIKKQNKETKVFKYKDSKKYKDIDFKDIRLNEGLFADKVILVEGATESLSLSKFYKNKFNSIFINESLFINCHGKENIRKVMKFFSNFKIPYYVIFDQDLDKIDKRKTSTTYKRGADYEDLKKWNKDIFRALKIDHNIKSEIANNLCTAFKNNYDDISKVDKNNIIFSTDELIRNKHIPKDICNLLTRLNEFIKS